MGNEGTRGSALLTVLWLSAALSAIAFSLASTVRGEAERAETALDGVRSYYLATGAVERALLYIQWGQTYRQPDGSSRYYAPGVPFLDFEFPSGVARVEVVPESSKINLNLAPLEELFRLLVAVGADPERAREIALGIVDWRTSAPAPTLFDQYYSSLIPSFRARHSSFEEIEELLLIRGMTPELFYGSYVRGAQGEWIPRGGLNDCVTVFGGGPAIDVNTVPAPVLAAIGVPPEAATALLDARRRMPFLRPEQLRVLLQGVPAAQRLGIGGGSLYTLRATARLRLPNGGLSDQRRSVAALVKMAPSKFNEPYHILRWYDNVWVQ